MRFAILVRDGGKWLLLTDQPGARNRQWLDHETALGQLLEEGWLVTGQTTGRSEGWRAYVLERTVH
jgi:hypothetical protein